MKKILIIDDQKDNLTTIEALLKIKLPGCKILTALSGKEGIDIANEEKPDTILLDIIMPGMDGYTVCKKLKENDLTKHIPVVMITAIKTDPESRIKGLDMGADAFLSKPIDQGELSAQVNVMLRIKKAEDELQAEKFQLDKKVKKKTKELRENNEKLNLEITKRKQVEEVLHNRERTYETLLNNLPGFTYRCKNDKNWTMDYISAGCENVTAYTYDDFLNNKNIAFNDIIDADYQEKVWAKWQKALKDKTSFEYEYPIFTKDKKLRWVWERGCGIFSDDGELLYLEGFITDITERKLTEEKLQNSEERFKKLSNLTFEGILIHNNGVAIDVNESLTRLFGYTEKEMIGKNLIKLLVPQEYHAKIKENIVKKIANPYEVLGRKKDGTLFPIEIEAKDIKSKDGEIRVTAIRDITERKLAEKSLRKSEEQQRTILQTAMDGFWLLDMKGNLVEANMAYSLISGYNMEELLTMKISDFEASETEVEIGSRIKKILKKGEDRFETQHRCKDGNIIDVEISVKYQSFDGGRFVCFLHDITNRKKAEKELLKYRENLEELVKERTKELEEKNQELERFNELFVGREFRIKELKNKVKELEEKLKLNLR
ncbi:MAG: PAS domain S-box protein [Mariniphaga sp.]|nr:PAS domain S-box protein [Mariniphaga sp.]